VVHKCTRRTGDIHSEIWLEEILQSPSRVYLPVQFCECPPSLSSPRWRTVGRLHSPRSLERRQEVRRCLLVLRPPSSVCPSSGMDEPPSPLCPSGGGLMALLTAGTPSAVPPVEAAMAPKANDEVPRVLAWCNLCLSNDEVSRVQAWCNLCLSSDEVPPV
jgi:hypothetical protein